MEKEYEEVEAVKENAVKEIEYLLNGEKKMEEKVEVKKEEVVEEVVEVKKAEITYDDFDKLDLRVGKIISSEKMENADKLLKFSVQIGEEVRTIVSGVACYYSPEDMLNKSVVVVTNLKPRKIRGVESYGMILYASNDKDLCFVTPAKEMESGTEVS